MNQSPTLFFRSRFFLHFCFRFFTSGWGKKLKVGKGEMKISQKRCFDKEHGEGDKWRRMEEKSLVVE